MFKNRKQIDILAANEILKNRKIIGLSGYSKPPENSQYMKRLENLLNDLFDMFNANGTDKYGMVYGTSDTGIDYAIEKIWEKRKQPIPLIGITCIEFIKWVPDEINRPPVLIYDEKEQYFRMFAKLLNVLIITGGRKHTFEYDLFSLSYGKDVYIKDCASEIDALEDGNITNAAKLVSKYLHIEQDDLISKLDVMN